MADRRVRRSFERSYGYASQRTSAWLVKIIFGSSVLLERRWYPIVDVVMLLVEDSRHALAPETSDIILTSEWLKERSIDTRELVRLSITGRSYDNLVDKTSVTLDTHCRRGG